MDRPFSIRADERLFLLRRQIDVDVLFLREGQQLLYAFLAADARLLVSAERRAEEVLADVVDPDESRFDRHRGAVRGRAELTLGVHSALPSVARVW